MPRLCSICSHAKCTAIDRMLYLGKKPSEISRRYPVSSDAVQRHRKHLRSQNTAERIAAPRNDIAEDIAAESRHAAGPPQDFASPLDIPDLTRDSPGLPHSHVVMVPDYDISVAIDPDTLGPADFQRQLVRAIQSRWKLLDAAHQAEVVHWLPKWAQDILYEV